MLPVKGSKLNIFSFGNNFNSLWSSSQPYNQATLNEAVSITSHCPFLILKFQRLLMSA